MPDAPMPNDAVDCSRERVSALVLGLRNDAASDRVLSEERRDWERRIADVLDALLARAEAAEKARDEAMEYWPEWAQKLLKMLQDFGWQYNTEEEIDIADEVQSWGADLEASCSADIERANKARDAAVAEAGRLREALSKLVSLDKHMRSPSGVKSEIVKEAYEEARAAIEGVAK